MALPMERTRRICRICPLLIKRFNLVGTTGISDYRKHRKLHESFGCILAHRPRLSYHMEKPTGGKHENLQLPHKRFPYLQYPTSRECRHPQPTTGHNQWNHRKRNPPPCGLERSGSTHTSRQNGKVQSQPKCRTTGHQPGTFQRHHHTERNATSRRKQKNQRYAHRSIL